jgi:hypothetical protein
LPQSIADDPPLNVIVPVFALNVLALSIKKLPLKVAVLGIVTPPLENTWKSEEAERLDKVEKFCVPLIT